MSEKKIFSSEIINGVRVTTFEDGSLSFEPINQSKTIDITDDRSWWLKLKDWWNDSSITPYVKIRDLADPFGDRKDSDAGSDGKHAIEAGIKVKF